MTNQPLLQRYVQERAEHCNMYFRSILLDQFRFHVKAPLQVQFQCKGLTLLELRGNAVELHMQMFLIRDLINQLSYIYDFKVEDNSNPALSHDPV